MQQIKITQALLKDKEVIQRIGKETFFETFAESNTDENMQRYLNENFNIEKVSEELSNEQSLFFVAWDGPVPIGYLKLNTGEAQTEALGADSMEIERIYVMAAYHGKKVGQLLYEKALEIAREMNKTTIWLGVWEKNPKAIRFYGKNGFVAFSRHIFKLGEDEQMDVLMKKVLA